MEGGSRVQAWVWLDHSTGIKPHPSSHSCKLRGVSSFCMPRTTLPPFFESGSQGARLLNQTPGATVRTEIRKGILLFSKPGLNTPLPSSGYGG